jgi:pantothenate kinase
MKYILIILFLASFLFSCTDDYTLCTESKVVQFSSFFYKKVGAQEVTANAPNLKIINLANNLEIFSNQINVASFSLVLNPLTDTMRFHISLASTLQADTLTVIYSTANKTLSAECGVISTHKILKAITTKHTLDTVKLTNVNVDNSPEPNSRIIFQ